MVTLLSLTVLFVLSFLGPSPIPVPTDAFALGLVVLGIHPYPVLTTLIVGHIIGLFFFYHLGISSGRLINHWEAKKHLHHYQIAHRLYKKFGKYSLLLCNIPFLGKPLVMAAGVFRLSTQSLTFWYILGKVIWYGGLALFFLNR